MATDTYSGSCLCGKVQYRIEGEIKAFFHCHCRRCRKATGTGHASNIILGYTLQAFTAGDSLLKRYDVPDAERFHTRFCGECGSPVPRINASKQVAVIPAGSLDESPPLEPTGRIFQDSRSDWSCSGDDLPRWERYPDA